MATEKRRLVAVMFTDIAGYSALSERDESLAIELLNEHQLILRRIFPSFGGREIKATGDGFFVEFGSVIDAVNCAVAIQTALFERNLSIDESRRLEIRIGLHLGDVVDQQDDRFGNEVNIAARIEPFAPVGGICISQQVFDQIGTKLDLPLKKMGKLRLKNIRERLPVHRVVLPWEPQRASLSQRLTRFFFPEKPRSPQAGLLTAQALAVLTVITVIFVRLWFPVQLVVDRGPVRSIASSDSTPVRKLLLPNNWKYALGDDAGTDTRWKPFDDKHTSRYADKISGDYLLKLSFIGAGGFRHPAMVLGLISDAHRVYLNGKFIGGSEHFSDLAIYSFDPSLIRPGLKNTILIKARTRNTFTPGLNPLAGLRPSIGEFEDVSRATMYQELSFRWLRPLFFAISLLLAFASLVYYVIRRSDLRYLYYATFLLLGALCLSYYNTFVLASVSYPFYRYLKLLALGLSSFVLFSLYLNTRGLRRLEFANTLLGILFATVAFVVLVPPSLIPSRYIARHNLILELAIGYTLLWLTTLAIRGAMKFSTPGAIKKVTREQVFNVSLITTFGTTIALLCYSAIMNGELSEIFGSYLMREEVKNAALAYPFAFAVVVLIAAIRDYTRKSKDIGYKRRKDDLMLGIASLSANSSDFEKVIEDIQARVTSFLGATRSTIYLLHGSAERENLEATYIHGPVGAKERVTRTLDPATGIIGHCLRMKSAVFVENIATDPRFKIASRQNEGAPGYRTGSFMVFPLLVGAHLLGAITISDRLDGKSFSREDFCLMHLVAKDLAFVISHSQLQMAEESKAAG